MIDWHLLLRVQQSDSTVTGKARNIQVQCHLDTINPQSDLLIPNPCRVVIFEGFWLYEVERMIRVVWMLLGSGFSFPFISVLSFSSPLSWLFFFFLFYMFPSSGLFKRSDQLKLIFSQLLCPQASKSCGVTCSRKATVFTPHYNKQGNLVTSTAQRMLPVVDNT